MLKPGCFLLVKQLWADQVSGHRFLSFYSLFPTCLHRCQRKKGLPFSEAQPCPWGLSPGSSAAVKEITHDQRNVHTNSSTLLIPSLLLVWGLDQSAGSRHCSGTGWKSRLSHSAPDLLDQNLHFNQIRDSCARYSLRSLNVADSQIPPFW